MRKPFLLALFCLASARMALAQSTPDPLQSESAPPIEAPYPGGDEGAIRKPVPTPTPKPRIDDHAAARRSALKDTPARPPESRPEDTTVHPVEKPRAVNEDGDYIYDTKETTPELVGRPGIEKPTKANPSGSFDYKKADKPVKFSGNPNLEAPVSTTPTGEFQYVMPHHDSNRRASFRVGVMTAPSITNPNNNKSWSDVYGSAPLPVFMGDYEVYHPHWWTFGRLALLVGSGITTASGQGYFVDPTRTDRPDQKFQFFLLPNTATLNYSFQFTELQWVVPYVEAGAGYYTFVEVRDDAKNTKFGGSPVGLASGGCNFLFDRLDPHAIRQLDNDFGITHLWLTLQARAVLGLEQATNFTSVSFNMGIIVAF